LANALLWDTQRDAGIAPGRLLHFAEWARWAQWVTKRELEESVNRVKKGNQGLQP